MSSQFYTIFAVVLGSGIGYKLNFPAGAMVGGLLGGLIVKAFFTMGLDPKIDWLSYLSQALVAYVLVRGSDFSSLKELPKYLPAAIAYSLLLLVFTLGWPGSLPASATWTFLPRSSRRRRAVSPVLPWWRWISARIPRSPYYSIFAGLSPCSLWCRYSPI